MMAFNSHGIMVFGMLSSILMHYMSSLSFVGSCILTPSLILSLILDCRSLMHRQWRFELGHTFHKFNQVVDQLAKRVAEQHDYFVIFTATPPFVTLLLLADVFGLPIPRLVGSLLYVSEVCMK
ncbi:hypothetical protein ACH5RR_026334 [Cinchona calisaya]|uniref:Uncharacterized protein n=1 Tax=Cinchona calisaya TaxID=153742 RepID=A0ABD2Z694_9GENT